MVSLRRLTLTYPFNSGFLMVVLAGICFGSSGILAKIAMNHGLSPLSTVSYRFAIASVILLPTVLVLRARSLLVRTVDALLLAIHSFLGVSMGILLYFQTINLTSVSLAVLLLYLNPVFSLLVAKPILREKVTWSKVLAATLVVAGCLLVFRIFEVEALRLNMEGLGMGLGAGLAYAFYTVFGKLLLDRRGIGMESLTIYSILYAALTLSIFQALLTGFEPISDIGAWLALTGLAVIPTLLAFALYISGLERIEASKVSIIGTVEIATALILSFFILGERLDPVQWVGALMVLCGVAIVQKH